MGSDRPAPPVRYGFQRGDRWWTVWGTLRTPTAEAARLALDRVLAGPPPRCHVCLGPLSLSAVLDPRTLEPLCWDCYDRASGRGVATLYPGLPDVGGS